MVDELVALLPPGTARVAHKWLCAGETLLGVDPSPPAAVMRDLVLPLIVETDWPEPAQPTRVNGGWVQADVIQDDLKTFESVRSTMPDAGPEELAAEAQRWRLPVLPYRANGWPRRPAAEVMPSGAGLRPRFDGSLHGLTVIDMSTMWAGPLATKLLAEAGARVIKIDPDCRPDGFRQRPNLYRDLNGHKEITDLDLRLRRDRDRFEDLIASADLLVHSFSGRVLPNFGYGMAQLMKLNGSLATVSISGFPRGCPEQDWLAYGTGAHAISGNGMVNGQAAATPVGYPDPVAGYAAFTCSLDALGSAQSAEVPLVSAMAVDF